MTENKNELKINRTFLILLLGLLNTITPFSIDMYLPAFPDMATEFGVPISRIALSVSTYFLGFAFGQIFVRDHCLIALEESRHCMSV